MSRINFSSKLDSTSKERQNESEADATGEVSTTNDGNDDYLRRMMANLSNTTPSPPPEQPPKTNIITIKDEMEDIAATAISPAISLQIITDQFPAQSSPSYAAAKWAAKFGSAGKATPPICPSSSSSSSSSKMSWRDDFVAAVQATKRKRKAARKETKVKKKPKVTEAQSKPDTDDDDDSITTSSPSRRQGRRVQALEFTPTELVAYREPFRYGWRREMVYRKSQKKGSVADVYYLSPSGVRLRSMPEIDEYLRAASEKVNRANFCFRRITIGFDEIPGAEIVRGTLSPDMRRLEVVVSPNVRPASAEKRVSSTPVGAAADKSLEETEKEETTEDDSVSNAGERSDKSGKPKALKLTSLYKESLAMKEKPALSFNVESPVLSTLKKKLFFGSSTSQSASSVNSSKSSRMQKLRKVAISESQRQKKTLQKGLLPAVVFVADQEKPSMTSAAMVRHTKARKSIAVSRHSSARDGSESSSVKDVVEQEIRVSTCNNAFCGVAEPERPDVPCVSCLRLFHKDCLSGKGRILDSAQFECNECGQNQTFATEGNGSVFIDDEFGSDSDPTTKRPQSVDTVAVEKSINAGKHRPSSAFELPGNSAVSSTTIGSSSTLVGESLRKPSLSSVDSNQALDKCGSPPLDMAVNLESQDPTRVEVFFRDHGPFDPSDSGQTSPEPFGFDRFHDYVKALSTIFSFLSVRDLLSCQLVCKAWNIVSHGPDVWNVARLKGARISRAESWIAAAEFLKDRGTQELDLTGCGYGQMSARLFTDVALPVFSRFVVGFHFGQCIPKLLEATSKACRENLRRITMTLSRDPYANVGRSSNMISSAPFNYLALCVQLVELRLSAADPSGRHQRVFLNGDGLAALASLTQLRILALFDIRALDEKAFKFLDSVPLLRVLEIGDCQCWTRETYSKLRRLKNLRRLRLEYFEPGASGEALADSLSVLHELREVDFVKYSLDYSYTPTANVKSLLALSALPKLHTLRLYPDLDGKWPAPTWRRTVDVLSHYSNLKRLELGITMDEGCLAPGEAEMATTLKPPFACNRQRQPQKIGFVNTEALKQWMAEKLPNTVINVIDCLSSSDLAATRVSRWW